MKIVRGILGWVITVVLCMVYGGLLGCYFAWIVSQQTWQFENFLPAMIAVTSPFLPFLCILLCIIFLTRLCRKKGWDTKGYWRGGLLVLLVLPMIWLLTDAPAIENDYMREILTLPSKDVKAGYETLMTLRKGGGLKLQVDMPWAKRTDIPTNALAYAEQIEKAWSDISGGREVIEKLDTFEGFTDLAPDVPLDWETPIMGFVTLLSIARGYWAYAMLKCEQGEPAEAARELVKLHSVARKGLPYASILVDKMIWIAIARENIEAAYRITNSRNCNSAMLEMLRRHFEPLTEEEISLTQVFIAEYLGMRNLLETLKDADFFTVYSVDCPARHPQPLWQKAITRILLRFGFRRNMTVLDMKKHYDLVIAGASKHPPDVSEAGIAFEKYCTRPPLKNMGGWFLVATAIPSFSRCVETTSKTKVLSDLLAVELHKRLGEELALQDYLTGENYKLEEKTGRLFSTGPDGQAGTEDDIMLGQCP